MTCVCPCVPCGYDHMASAANKRARKRSIMASNVTAKLENGKLIITCDLSAGVVRRAGVKKTEDGSGTGDVLCAIDFERLSALVGASGVTGAIKVSLGVYLQDKERNAVTQAPASAQVPFNPATASVEALRAWAMAQAQGTTAPAPAPTQEKKPRSDKQRLNDEKLATAGKERLAAMRAGTYVKK